MNPAVHALLAAAREEYEAIAAIHRERKQEERQAKRRLLEARTHLEQLRTRAESFVSGVRGH